MMTKAKSLWPSKQKTPNQKTEEKHERSAWEAIDSYGYQSVSVLPRGFFCSIC